MLHARRLPASAVAISGVLGLLVIDILSGGEGSLPAAALIALVLAVALAAFLVHWPRVIAGLLLVVLLIPSDGRYILPGNLPFQLEPYRVVVGLLLAGWIGALLVDPRVRFRATKFEGPLILIAVATLGSEIANPSRVSGLSSSVIKAIWLFLCFVLALYLITSVVRTRKVLDKLVIALVSGGCVVALAAVVERRTGDNLFNHLRLILPILEFHQVGESLMRGGSLRAIASAGHPIELSTTMSMLMPFAIYLAVTRHQRRWWAALFVLVLGELSTSSRTGIIGIAAMIAVFLWLRPRQTLRFWPALIPLLLAVHVLMPGSIGGVYEGFFPSEGLIASQSYTGVHGAQLTRLSRLGPAFHEFGEHNVLFGQGYGTRITGATAIPGTGAAAIADNAQILDDQWLGTLLETGLLGVLGWLWLFARAIRRLAARAKLEPTSAEGWLAVSIAAAILGFALSMETYDAFSFTQATFLVFTMLAFAAILLQLPRPAARRAVPPSEDGTSAIARELAIGPSSDGANSGQAVLSGRAEA
jgi:polysaccharide biosynthesis protein PslJ